MSNTATIFIEPHAPINQALGLGFAWHQVAGELANRIYSGGIEVGHKVDEYSQWTWNLAEKATVKIRENIARFTNAIRPIFGGRKYKDPELRNG